MNRPKDGNAAGVGSGDWLAPFLRLAEGIPDNWPDECILRYNQRPDGSLCLGYYGINDATDGITIGQWRAMQRGVQAEEEAHALGFRSHKEALDHQDWLLENGGSAYKAWRASCANTRDDRRRSSDSAQPNGA